MTIIGTSIAFLPAIKGWVHQHETFFAWMVVISIAMFVLSLLVTPYIIIRMGEDYFLDERQAPEESFKDQHPALRLTALVTKNLVGVILILAGIAMLALPGQGLLTIFMGLMLMNFPGKRSLELKIIRLPRILKSVNWIRAKADHPPLNLPPR